VVAEFIPGLELSRLLYAEVVQPLLESAYPGLRYSAALIGPGSEVFGFDSARSTDHDWGPRLKLFLADDGLAGEITELLGQRLPETFRGWPVAFNDTTGRHGVRHWVQVTGLGTWLTGALGFDPRHGVTLPDWLATDRAIGVAVPSSDTIVEVSDGVVTGMPRRDALARCQTPQGFRLSVIRRAYQLADADPGFAQRPATDDCGIVLRYLPEVAVRIVPGSERNIKITYPGDLALAETLLRAGEPGQPA